MSDDTTAARQHNLELMLRARLAELQEDVRTRIRTARTDGADLGSDEIDYSDALTQGDMDFALIQMRAETLARVGEALRQFDAGAYGTCAECRADISESRLRALPFAVRCKRCEESREQHVRQTRQVADRLPRLPFAVTGS